MFAGSAIVNTPGVCCRPLLTLRGGRFDGEYNWDDSFWQSLLLASKYEDDRSYGV
jgi:hypothetical protein